MDPKTIEAAEEKKQKEHEKAVKEWADHWGTATMIAEDNGRISIGLHELTVLVGD